MEGKRIAAALAVAALLALPSCSLFNRPGTVDDATAVAIAHDGGVILCGSVSIATVNQEPMHMAVGRSINAVHAVLTQNPVAPQVIATTVASIDPAIAPYSALIATLLIDAIKVLPQELIDSAGGQLTVAAADGCKLGWGMTPAQIRSTDTRRDGELKALRR